MKTPSIESVKELYKKAKIVNSAYFKEPFDITEYDFESIYVDGLGDMYIYHKTDKEWVKSLFDNREGLAEILTYIQ